MPVLEPDAASTDDQVRLTLPALLPYSRVVRLAVTSLASRNGFSYDDVEDLRIAVGEVFAVVVDPPSPDARVRFTCTLHPEAIEVVGRREPPAPIAEISDLTRQILAGVADEAEIDQVGGRIRISKRLEGRP